MSKVPLFHPSETPIAIGFSARALAQATATGLGCHPIVVDRFADHDCRSLAKANIGLPDRPDDSSQSAALIEEISAFGGCKASPVLLGGGTENWPSLLDELHRNYRVLGPTSAQLRQLRSIQTWQACSAESGVAFPATSWDARSPGGEWLCKPLNGAGGHAIRRAAQMSLSLPAAHYWQLPVTGRALGVYCMLHSDGQATLLGACESLSAGQWPGPREFIYRGSLGPDPLTSQQSESVLNLCRNIHATSGSVRGWLQFDFIEDDARQLWLLEINPRWAAGMEILFLAGDNPVAHHCHAWQCADQFLVHALEQPMSHPQCDGQPHRQPMSHSDETFQSSTQSLPRPTALSNASFGKAVVYADRDLPLSRELIARLHELPSHAFADLPSFDVIPRDKSVHLIRCGEPMLTVRATGERHRLLEQLGALRETALHIFE